MLKIVFITAFVLQEASSPMIISDLNSVPDPTCQLISDPDPGR